MKVDLDKFILLEKKGQGYRLTENMISIGKTGISFSSDIAKKLGIYVLIYLNREDNLIGFKGTKDSIRGFRLGHYKHNFNIQPKNLMKDVNKGVYNCETESGFIIIKGALNNENKV